MVVNCQSHHYQTDTDADVRQNFVLLRITINQNKNEKNFFMLRHIVWANLM